MPVNGSSNGSGVEAPAALPPRPAPGVPATAPKETAPVMGSGVVRTIPRVSPLRGVALDGDLEVVIGGPRADRTAGVVPSDPITGAAPPSDPRVDALEPASLDPLAEDASDEPPWPDEARGRLAAERAATTVPVEASAGQHVQVRFARAPQESLLQALQVLRDVLREHPGDTPVVLHIPAGADERPMQLRAGVAYDAELLAAVRRRLGEGIADLRLT